MSFHFVANRDLIVIFLSSILVIVLTIIDGREK